MSKPTILTVDDDPAIAALISRDLRRRHGSNYRVVRTTSGAEALGVLKSLALRAQVAALIGSDQRMPVIPDGELCARQDSNLQPLDP